MCVCVCVIAAGIWCAYGALAGFITSLVKTVSKALTFVLRDLFGVSVQNWKKYRQFLTMQFCFVSKTTADLASAHHRTAQLYLKFFVLCCLSSFLFRPDHYQICVAVISSFCQYGLVLGALCPSMCLHEKTMAGS